MLRRDGFILTLSSPSGCGKTTISKRILAEVPDTVRSISANTRKQRPGEVDGKDYIFVSDSQFDNLIAEDKFIEYVEIYGTRRGTLKTELLKNIECGLDTICIIDRNGVLALKSAFGNRVVSIFVFPPSMEELKRRIIARAGDNDEEMKIRLDLAEDEMSFYFEYDYCVINDDLNKCVYMVKNIIEAERNKTHRINKIL
jgi:guanylate kinase